MKKTLGMLILIIGILTVIIALRILCISKPVIHEQTTLPQTWPKLPPADQLGQPVTFEMTYHGGTQALSGYNLGSDFDPNAPFVKDVLSKIKNKYVITRCDFFEQDNCQHFITEYKDEVALAVYFDLDADGKLSERERIETITVLDNGIRDYDAYEFVTPDFTITNEDATKIPFRIRVRAAFINTSNMPNGQPLIMIAPMGRYEGTAKIGDQELRFYLFSSLYSRSYLKCGQNSYAMIPPSQPIDQWLDIHPFSSLITHKNIFYRVAIEGSDSVNGSLKVRLYEDKTPRGKLALSIRGKENLKHGLADATFQGTKDTTILFTMNRNIEWVPQENYVISYGHIFYGKDKKDDYYVLFRNTPAFTIKQNNIAAVEIGRPEMEMQVTASNGNKQYKNQFPEGSDVYIKIIFTGIAGETYEAFNKMIDNNTKPETINAHIRISDDQGNEIINRDMNYG